MVDLNLQRQPTHRVEGEEGVTKLSSIQTCVGNPAIE